MGAGGSVGGEIVAMSSFAYEEDFRSLERWILRPSGHAHWQVEPGGGAFRGFWQARFNSLVFHRPLIGDAALELEFRIFPMVWERALGIRNLPEAERAQAIERRRVLDPTGQRNLNILWKMAGPQGEDFYEAFDEWFGKGKMGLEFFRGYFFTFTYLWARLRRCPGYQLVSDRPDVRVEIGRHYHLRIVQEGGRLRYWLNGDLVHDWSDAEPYTRGYVGFVLSTSQVLVTRIHLEAEEAGEACRMADAQAGRT